MSRRRLVAVPAAEGCLYTLLHADRAHHERILRELVTPLAAELRGDPRLRSLFFARYNLPDWQLRFRILGDPDWVASEVRGRVERGIAALSPGLVDGVELARYDRELERYGGEEGMALAEEIFHHDTYACLDLLAAEERGALRRSRRELSLLLTDRFLDLFDLGVAERLAFYRHGYRWALEMKTWEASELALLEARYRALHDDLFDLFYGETASDEAAVWGGEEAARIAARSLADTAPVARRLLAAHRAGRIRQDLGNLLWSVAHMHANRLGIDPAPEAILRYFMARLTEEHGLPSARLRPAYGGATQGRPAYR